MRKDRLDRSGENLDLEEEAATRHAEHVARQAEQLLTKPKPPICRKDQYLLFETGERIHRVA